MDAQWSTLRPIRFWRAAPSSLPGAGSGELRVSELVDRKFQGTWLEVLT